jgi:integrase
MVTKKFTTAKTRKGRTYQYFRKDGQYTRLPDDPKSEEYDREYWRLMRGGNEAVQRYTFDKLIISYRKSPKWESLAPRTKSDYNRVLEYLFDTVGKKDPTKMRRSSVIEAQTANKHRARFANYIPSMLSILFEHAIDLDWQRDNPAKGVSKLKTGDGHAPWPQGAISTYRTAATGNDLLIMELAIGTGQRISDILKMKWSDIENNGINVKQGKTGTILWIPFTNHLSRILNDAKPLGLHIVSGPHGQKVNLRSVQDRILKIRRENGLADYQIHGWRYTAATLLAEAGATDAEIAAITGHKSLEMVAKYSRKNNQRTLATNAQNKRNK